MRFEKLTLFKAKIIQFIRFKKQVEKARNYNHISLENIFFNDQKYK